MIHPFAACRPRIVIGKRQSGMFEPVSQNDSGKTLVPDRARDIAIANGVKYGLSASVFTRDLSRAHRVAARLESGMVWVNTWLLRDLRVPFGGMKESGVGREGGFDSLDFFTEAKNVCVKL